MPRVSVITATYNRSEVLRWAIESVRSQTFADWEHIIVGDACTDDSAEVVASFNDSRIRFHNRSQNFGEQSEPNNDGLNLAAGELVAYLNHDDLWFPDHLQKLAAYIRQTKADLVHALPLNIDSHGQAFCGDSNAELRYDPSQFVPASLWLARRELFEDLNGWRPAAEIYARNPSQDVLFRSWRLAKNLRCHPDFTAIILASGGRPNCYVERDDSQHAEIWNQMQNPRFREQLAIKLVTESARKLKRLSSTHLSARISRVVDRRLVKMGLHPDAVRNRLAFRRKGWWIRHLRELRGLPPLTNRKAS